MSTKMLPTCADCPFPASKKVCYRRNGKGPENCPTISDPATCNLGPESFEDNQEMEFYLKSVEGSGVLTPRLMETVDFAKRMNYSKLGIAFCGGLRNEAKKISAFFKGHGFEVYSAICKIGRNNKSQLVSNIDKKEAKQTLCNPIGQAELLNNANTEFNVVVGLCVGHDSLFLKHSSAMSTILVVKDRQLGHNPIGAINTLDSYYSFLKKKE